MKTSRPHDSYLVIFVWQKNSCIIVVKLRLVTVLICPGLLMVYLQRYIILIVIRNEAPTIIYNNYKKSSTKVELRLDQCIPYLLDSF